MSCACNVQLIKIQMNTFNYQSYNELTLCHCFPVSGTRSEQRIIETSSVENKSC